MPFDFVMSLHFEENPPARAHGSSFTGNPKNVTCDKIVFKMRIDLGLQTTVAVG